jgi:hypothetical protein
MEQCIKETDIIKSIVNDLCSVCSGTACDAILEYLELSDCSPRTRRRILDLLTKDSVSEYDKNQLKERARKMREQLPLLHKSSEDNILTPKRIIV